MITQDKRRDSGEYYPGGRVIARPGTAPQQVVVQWSDVQGKPQIAPLPERYKDSDVKTKINEIASKFATVLMAAFVVWTACADVTVQKKRKDEIYNDELIVVDVTGGGGVDTNAVADIANHAISTNAVTTNLTARLDAKLDDDFASLTNSVAFTNAVAHVSPKVEVVAPSTDASASGKATDAKATGDALTNLSSSVSGLQSSKANRAESGHADEIATLDADGNPTHSGYKPSDFAPDVSGGYIPVQGCDYFPDKGSGAFWGNDYYGFGSGSADNAFSFIMFDEWWPTYNRDRPYSVPAISLAWFGLENHVLLKGYGTQVAENTKWYYMKGNPTTFPVPGDEIAVMGDIPDVAPLAADIRSAYQYSRAVSLYMTGSTNAWFAGTNYVFGADAATRQHFAWESGMDAATVPCSMALWENRDGVKQCVWDQRDWTVWYWSFKAGQMRGEIAATNAAIYAAIAADENHAWSKRYASSGRVNPDPTTTFIDTQSVCLSPGMNWETVATVGGCGYWTIVGDGAVIGGSDTNAVLEIKDFEGNSIMQIAKGEHRLAWLSSSDFVPGASMTDANGLVCFDMRADAQPVGYFSTTPEAADFTAESDANCPAQYSWENRGGGVWRVHFLLKPGVVSNACFAKFLVEIEGKTQIRYGADIVIGGFLIYNGVKIAPTIPAGAAGGTTVTWKVVQ